MIHNVLASFWDSWILSRLHLPFLFVLLLAGFVTLSLASTPGHFNLKQSLSSADALLVMTVERFEQTPNGLLKAHTIVEEHRMTMRGKSKMPRPGPRLEVVFTPSTAKFLKGGERLVFLGAKKGQQWVSVDAENMLFVVKGDGVLTSLQGSRITKLTNTEVRFERFRKKPDRGMPPALVTLPSGKRVLIEPGVPLPKEPEQFLTLTDLVRTIESVDIE